MNDKRSYEYHLDDDLPLSASRPGHLEQDITACLKNTINIEKLITKSLELDGQTVHSRNRNYLFYIICIFLLFIISITFLYFFSSYLDGVIRS